eukprot:scaffold7.g3510.t1
MPAIPVATSAVAPAPPPAPKKHSFQAQGQLIRSPAAWTVKSLQQSTDWVYEFTKDDVAELERAASSALALDKPIQVGLPVDRWTREQTVAVWWGIGLHWGRARSNNAAGHLVGHIRDLGRDPDASDTRLYATNAAQPYHNDGCADLVALLCLAQSAEGGASHWTSAISIHNAIVQRRTDLLPVLTGPWFFDRKGEVPPGKKPFFEIPVFSYHEGYLSMNFSSNYYFLSQRHPEVPRLTPAHLEAIKLVEDLAQSDELRMDWILQPGDIQLLSNHTVLHARGAFRDGPTPGQQRHLLRLWISPEGERPLPAVYGDIMGGSLEVGNRGGIICEDTRLHVPLHPED